MTALQKRAAANRATTEAQKAIRAALAVLDRREDLCTNGYGIYGYPLVVEATMEIAIRPLDAARKIMKDTDWPTDDDYDAAEREQIARWEEEDRQ